MTLLSTDLTKNIITMFQLDKLDEVELEQAIDRIGKIIFSRVTLKVMEMLPPEKLDTFQEVIESEEKNPGGTVMFLQTNIPQFANLINDEIASFKKESDDLRTATNL